MLSNTNIFGFAFIFHFKYNKIIIIIYLINKKIKKNNYNAIG